jgi:hypothetical protein
MNAYETPAENGGAANAHGRPRTGRTDHGGQGTRPRTELEDFAASWGHQLLCASKLTTRPQSHHDCGCVAG